MACPLFLPSSPLAGMAQDAAPLGDIYDGQCSADPGTTIPVTILKRCCNLGYARGVCALAAQTDADAFRFLVKACPGATVVVAWSIERDHHPVAVGTSVLTECQAEADQPLERQARAYAAASLRKAWLREKRSTTLPRP